MNEMKTASEFGQNSPTAPADRRTEQSPPPREQTHTRSKRGLLGAGAALALAAGLGYGGWRDYTARQDAAAVVRQRLDFVPTVQVAPVRASADTMIVTLPGTTFAWAVANIYARANGYIEKRNVDIGDHVRAGDLLAELSAPELDHQISQAQATLTQTQATLRQNEASRSLAKLTNDRIGTLVRQGWATTQLGDTDRLSVDAQEASVGVAQANIIAQQSLIRVLDQERSYLRVIAPFDGVVTQRAVDVGSLVQIGSTFMFTMMQSSVIRVQVFVPQDEAFGLDDGDGAVIRVPEMPNRTFPGKVTRISDALQQGTRTLLTEIDVPNPDGALTPGIYCTVELHIPRKVPSLVVPASALIFNRNGLQVAVDENGVVRLHKVTVARDLGTEIEVRDGVKAGDEAILNPMVNVADGNPVHSQASTSNIEP
jgi:RND family efflux transporter MFP subunit